MSGLLTRSSFTTSRSSLALIAGATIIAAIAVGAIKAKAGELMVKYDQSQLLRISRQPNDC